MSSDFLTVKTTAKVIEEANAEIEESRSGKQMCLKTRWPNINDALMGGFRFNNNVLMAGASGHGKSYFLNLLIQDILNPAINSAYIDPFVVIHFNFEMSGSDEILRSTSSKTGISYGDLLSSTSKLDDEQYKKAVSEMKKLNDKRLLFVETPGTKEQILNTIMGVHETFPGHGIIVALDHTLLVEDSGEGSEIEMIKELGKMFIKLKKQIKLLTILVGQLNDKIEDNDRRNPAKPGLHFPIKTDIFGLIWAQVKL